jgi:hypothetical protein
VEHWAGAKGAGKKEKEEVLLELAGPARR